MRISAENLGPIGRAEVDLSPLTLFVGPNNAGKSYLALLVYAMVRSIAAAAVKATLSHAPWLDEFLRLGQFGGLETLPDEMTTPYARLQDEARQTIDEAVDLWKQAFHSSTVLQLRRCYSSGLGELVRTGTAERAHLSISQEMPLFRQDLTLDRLGESQRENGNIALNAFRFSEIREVHIAGRAQYMFEVRSPAMDVAQQVLSPFSGNCYYLPAARSGYLSSHRLLASVLVSRSPLVGVDAMEFPRLSGVVADFISTLLQFEPNIEGRTGPGAEVAAFLEAEMTGGTVEIVAGNGGPAYPDIQYRQGETRLSLNRCSSMVAEVAPIILFLKHLVMPGDLLIVEEPEAHLHPDNQRILARAIVKMIRRGIHVLATTHSDYFLQQVSNFLMLGTRPAEREGLGYSEDDFLTEEDVSAYLFSAPDPQSGSQTERIPCSSVEGISDEAFGRVVESLYNEKVHIERGLANA